MDVKGKRPTTPEIKKKPSVPAFELGRAGKIFSKAASIAQLQQPTVGKTVKQTANLQLGKVSQQPPTYEESKKHPEATPYTPLEKLFIEEGDDYTQPPSDEKHVRRETKRMPPTYEEATGREGPKDLSQG